MVFRDNVDRMLGESIRLGGDGLIAMVLNNYLTSNPGMAFFIQHFCRPSAPRDSRRHAPWRANIDHLQ
jgi:hypothetical protein